MKSTHNQLETIVARATPQGMGAVAMIRMSGNTAVRIADRVFIGARSLLRAESQRVYRGLIKDGQERIDEVLLSVYKAPNSYTGEDLVEIWCHGGQYLTGRLLMLLTKHGARIAEPGEFTKRAFVNGRMDLVQAEAVCDIIQAKTAAAHRSSITQLSGALSERILLLQKTITEMRALLELELDFAEEDIEIVAKADVVEKMTTVIHNVEKFVDNYEHGRLIRGGVKLVITGKPNVGKSSLLNALLKTDRVIVTDIPGTTRDAIEEALNIEGLLFRVVDTAGLRVTSDRIEQEGIKKTEQHITNSDVIVIIVDKSDAFSEEDTFIFNRVQELLKKEQRGEVRDTKILVAANKIDLRKKWDAPQFVDLFGEYDIVDISAKTGAGLPYLEKKLLETALHHKELAEDDYLITNIRHFEAFQETLVHLRSAQKSLERGLSEEFVVVDLHGASNCLGKIIGVISSADVLNMIFSNFCIGK